MMRTGERDFLYNNDWLRERADHRRVCKMVLIQKKSLLCMIGIDSLNWVSGYPSAIYSYHLFNALRADCYMGYSSSNHFDRAGVHKSIDSNLGQSKTFFCEVVAFYRDLSDVQLGYDPTFLHSEAGPSKLLITNHALARMYHFHALVFREKRS